MRRAVVALALTVPGWGCSWAGQRPLWLPWESSPAGETPRAWLSSNPDLDGRADARSSPFNAKVW